LFAEADYGTKRIRSKAAVRVQVQLQGDEEGGCLVYDIMEDAQSLTHTMLHLFIHLSIHVLLLLLGIGGSAGEHISAAKHPKNIH